ncbi:MAG: DUF433 domain-containing protein [Pirellulaceae bacterium]|nr:DUF433 domain-containing protein [Pirellulaceae bacterium]
MIESSLQHIETKPEVCGGRPCIAGTRVRVQDVYVWHDLQGLSADEIVSRYPHLTLGGVYSALAYYWDHRDEIAEQMRDETATVEGLKQRFPSPLAEKARSLHAANHPLPPG